MRPIKDANENRGVRIFLLIENRLLREALASICRKHSDISIVGANRHSDTAQTQITESCCDVLLVDQTTAKNLPPIFFPNLAAASANIRIIFFGMEDDPEIFLQAIQSGVSGYLLGDASAEDTLIAVRKVAQGEAVCPSWLCFHLFLFVARAAREGTILPNQRLGARFGLTPRQQQLVAFLARGLTNKEIAANMNLSEFTVKNHVHRIMRQLNAESRHAAVQAVCESGFAPQS